MRADARRNRDAILAAARSCFESEGINAPADTIAVRAGVGSATLYRNFPTRDDLLAAVMVDSVDALFEDARSFSERGPVAALQEWMFQLTWRLRTWQDLPTCIARAKGNDSHPVQPVNDRLVAKTAEFLVGAGVHVGVKAGDLFELLTALSWGVDRFGDDEEHARARVELATAGVVLKARGSS